MSSFNANTIHVGETPKSISFSGCGFLGFYHIGVASCIKMHAPDWLKNVERIYGCSAGSLVGALLLSDTCFGEACQRMMNIVNDLRSRYLGPLSPSFNLNKTLLKDIEDGLPKDAHIRSSGKLFISLTRFHDGKNVIVSDYKTRDELIQVLLSSCFVPFYSGIFPPKYRGVRYVDGGLSNNLPAFHDTITVSPWSGDSDICPKNDKSESLVDLSFVNTSMQMTASNLYRCSTMFFPPKPEVLREFCCQGFRETVQYLRDHGLFETAHPLRRNLSFSTLLHKVEQRRRVTRRMSYTARCMHKKDYQEALVEDPSTSRHGDQLISTDDQDVETFMEEHPLEECFDEYHNEEADILTPITPIVGDRYRNVFTVVQFYPAVVADHIIQHQFPLPPPVLDALESRVDCGNQKTWKRSMSVIGHSKFFQLSFKKTYYSALFFLKNSSSFPSHFSWMLNHLQQAVNRIHLRMKCSGRILIEKIGQMGLKTQKKLVFFTNELNILLHSIIKTTFTQSLPVSSTLQSLMHGNEPCSTALSCVNHKTNALIQVV